jgi:hypothetical protein
LPEGQNPESAGRRFRWSSNVYALRFTPRSFKATWTSTGQHFQPALQNG